MNEIIKKAFGRSIFLLFVSESIIITNVFFITLNDFIKLFEGSVNVGLIVVMSLTFVIIFWVYVRDEVKHGKKRG